MTLTDSGTSLVDGMAELVLAEAADCEKNRTMTPAVVDAILVQLGKPYFFRGGEWWQWDARTRVEAAFSKAESQP